MNSSERYQEWCKRATDREVVGQLQAMQNDAQAIENAFYKELAFGTGGLRGELGAGTNCLNVYTIRKVTQGIADCMKHYGYKTAAVSHDSRIHSDLFAATVAEVFAANGIKAYLTRELMPTPFLSFLTRETKADIGVMITASHNPAKYNGYKVYGSDGCQLTDARATEMIGYINAVDPFDVAVKPLADCLRDGSVEYASEEITERYLAAVYEQNICSADGIKVVYTPLNGTGYKLVPAILKKAGVKHIACVPEQDHPDGNFPTCPFPNPEKTEALKLGLALAEKEGADVLIATDPDADRIGIAVNENGKYRLMTGNETGTLLADFIFAARKANGTLPHRPVLVKTIVSTELAFKVVEEYGAQTFDVLTGFKYIGDIIGKLEAKGERDRFVFGFEESYGCLAGAHVRDKDAVVASMLVAEMTAYYKRQGKTLVDRINELYAKFGTYQHKLVSKQYDGAAGNAKMAELLAALRAELPTEIGGKKVVSTIDYLTQTEYDLPKSDVLSFKMSDGSQLIVRPSGTEPLIKFYLTAAKTPAENAICFTGMQTFIDRRFQ